MIAKGRLTAEWIAKYISNNPVEKLPENMLEEGSIVYKHTLLTVDGVTSGYLLVSPKGVVLPHTHSKDSETYWDILGNVMEVCNQGSFHFLKNDSEEKWLIVRFEKRVN